MRNHRIIIGNVAEGLRTRYGGSSLVIGAWPLSAARVRAIEVPA